MACVSGRPDEFSLGYIDFPGFKMLGSGAQAGPPGPRHRGTTALTEDTAHPQDLPGHEDPSQLADRFARARESQARVLLEDYVEMIGDLIAAHGEARVADIASRMGVTHPTATKAVARLKREGLATSRPYRGVFLTEAGQELSEFVRARHRTVVDLLIAVGVPSDAAEADAEGIEHHVSPEALEAFEEFLARKG